MTLVASPTSPAHSAPSGVWAQARARTRNTHPAHALAAQGYVVIPPAERMAHKTSLLGQTIHQRILAAFYRRMSVASHPGALKDPSAQGLTNAELSSLLGHEDLHRRTAELRACGLLTTEINGEQFSRSFNGAKGTVMRITPAGVAALRELTKTDSEE